jgi:hypothetical protein
MDTTAMISSDEAATSNVLPFLSLAFIVATIAVLAGCGGGGATSGGAPQASLTSIAISPSIFDLNPGAAQQFSAKATYSDGSMKDVTSTANWTSSDQTVVTISRPGVANGVSIGNAAISATVGNTSGNARLIVGLPIPASWAPTGVDYGLRKQCIRSVSPGQANFYFDDVDCPGPSYPAAAYWTTAVETQNSNPGAVCTGVTDQSLLINGANSGVSEMWTGSSCSGYSVELLTDFTNIANPCAPNSFTWVPLMDNWVGGGPFPPPDHLVTQFNVTFHRTLPSGSGATRAFAQAGAQWNVAGAGGNPSLAIFQVEINFYIDEPQWGRKAGLPPDVIDFKAVTNTSPPFYFVALDGSQLFAPISAQLSTPAQITVNWAAVLQHVIDEGLFSPPVNGWSNSSAAVTSTAAGTEVMNSIVGTGGLKADLIVSNYQEGSF